MALAVVRVRTFDMPEICGAIGWMARFAVATDRFGKVQLVWLDGGDSTDSSWRMYEHG